MSVVHTIRKPYKYRHYLVIQYYTHFSLRNWQKMDLSKPTFSIDLFVTMHYWKITQLHCAFNPNTKPSYCRNKCCSGSFLKKSLKSTNMNPMLRKPVWRICHIIAILPNNNLLIVIYFTCVRGKDIYKGEHAIERVNAVNCTGSICFFLYGRG